ncbi:3-deoxy-manno-octulosonate cytidylyltransferase, partial [Francisella tularensis subsp. holarctica]|uniref:cytidylyltransferase domain-containing protein n=1 Tax=Francisella tularensis TaxID=263 RepID=UPI0023AD3E45|nr:3-deoxy-manno-octulosonate cytidylyltransferase [Francisella tularensis subsp. holarctica]
ISEFFRHIGIYAYRVSCLKHYAELTVSPIEKYEALEQLRVLYNGYKIGSAQSAKSTGAGVDRLQAFESVRKFWWGWGR